jgi:hypothetical protein
MYNEVSFARGFRFSEEKLSIADLCQAVQKLNGGLIKQSHTRTCPVPGSRQRHGREPQNIIKLTDQKREPLTRTGDWHSDKIFSNLAILRTKEKLRSGAVPDHTRNRMQRFPRSLGRCNTQDHCPHVAPYGLAHPP